MYILKNALKNLTRNKGRNILLCIIMTAILSSVAISVIINTTSSEIVKNYKDKFGAEVYIQTDMKKLKEAIQSGKLDPNKATGITNNLIGDLAKSEYLKETKMQSKYYGVSDNLKALDQDEDNSQMVGAISGQGIDMPNLPVVGNDKIENLEDFSKGNRKIIDGKMYSKKEEAIVSEEFAKLNNLKVGDTIKVENTNKSEKYDPLKLKISGIYQDLTTDKEDQQGFMPKMAVTNKRNEILTSLDTLDSYNQKVKKDKDLFTIEARFFLKDPDLLSKFDKEAHEKGLSDMANVSTDKGNYDSIVKPVEGLQKISNVFMTLVLVFGGSVLILISILGIRERKYEIGVLRAMGMKKGKIALGIMFETLSIIVISLVCGLSIGSFSAQPISNILMKNQLKVQSEAMNDGFANIASIGSNITDATNATLTNLNVSLTGSAILAIIAIALLLGAISIGIGVIYIMRYEPMKILSERN
ncbi:ABC transporter permease [Clostridium botulinum]|uniref:ABC transporter, permease protein n=1 Tax=Clostridium botulinum (strain Langeland / NCTC 10281 / Type F) TaxID=441772 RepID=A7GD36_CLOBL|nr:FtsX-like permease family protein [Clostridium botulinum]ABS39755.1 ABC transporter, permease protein [Clostridium botulinum F str. Langeland]ADF99147.1 ABC transporter, permease protein [Clostridium botulinum F str. 230613]KKM43295.1 cell division protein FtsX [Clostridium botulinum]MBY6791187.1 FtsX-like permease family protein [Clostridium botulinum]MBY6936418.1 FtsX-like permease family protein [Clostridium botulinum]